MNTRRVSQDFPMLVPPTRRSRTVVRVVVPAIALGVFLAGGWFWAVAHLNIVGGEWACSQGEVPAGPNGVYSQCLREGSSLPAGWTFDPLGNRPLAYSCDGPGWVRIERPASAAGPSDSHEDCVRKGTPVPGGWHVAG